MPGHSTCHTIGLGVRTSNNLCTSSVGNLRKALDDIDLLRAADTLDFQRSRTTSICFSGEGDGYILSSSPTEWANGQPFGCLLIDGYLFAFSILGLYSNSLFKTAIRGAQEISYYCRRSTIVIKSHIHETE